eukprot:m.252921 g.252921  ORF g.252921 m.252921 type:complete len:87 (+) comp17191_c0_seq15:3380-3640(+)
MVSQTRHALCGLTLPAGLRLSVIELRFAPLPVDVEVCGGLKCLLTKDCNRTEVLFDRNLQWSQSALTDCHTPASPCAQPARTFGSR